MRRGAEPIIASIKFYNVYAVRRDGMIVTIRAGNPISGKKIAPRASIDGELPDRGCAEGRCNSGKVRFNAKISPLQVSYMLQQVYKIICEVVHDEKKK